MKKLLLLFNLLFVFNLAHAQKELLNAGPMPGHSSMREVKIWVQLKTTKADVQIAYWEKDKTETLQLSAVQTPNPDAFGCITLIAENLEPGKIYNYVVFINGQKVSFPESLSFQTQSLWQWRTDPPAFSFLAGSCTYINQPEYDRPGKPYGNSYDIFEKMAQHKPDFMLWLGDNTYLREVDNSLSGVYKRHAHSRGIPELQNFLRGTHHYAIWDDHDFGPNDADGTFPLKDITQKAFIDNWANAYYGSRGEGVYSQFQWADLDIFLLDNRYFRTPQKPVNGENGILGEAQLNWFLESLAASNAPFKIVCVGGQFLNNAANYENWAVFAKERERILKAIEERKIKNVVFLTGDRHFSEVSKLSLSGVDIYDFTISPLSSGISSSSQTEENLNRIENSVIKEHNFARFNVSGARKARVLKVDYFNATGKLLKSYELKSM